MQWVYPVLQIPARLCLAIYVKKYKTNWPAAVDLTGPVLLACNHPNSFLDAILLSAWFNTPIHSLARGDAFKNPFYAKLMGLLHMHPVYRTSEGAENLGGNYDTFEICKNVFRQNGIVLIFSEGLCINEWHLRPLKKGTARLAVSAWEEGIDLKVIPVGYNYHSFTSPEKIVHIHFGEALQKPKWEPGIASGKKLLDFNKDLKESLQQLVYEIPTGDTEKAKNIFRYEPPIFVKALVTIPGIIGYLLHYPFYKLVSNFVVKKAGGTGHYDSILLGILFFTYPIFLIVLNIILAFFIGWWSLLAWIVLPILAWCMVQWKETKGYGEVLEVKRALQ